MINHGKLLVVDDDAMMRKSLKEALQHFQFEVETAGNTQDAVTLVKTNQFDCALIDQVLDVQQGDILDGIELTKEIHNIQPEIAIIVYSGKEDTTDQSNRRAIEAGVYKYIYKPFTVHQIKEILDSLLPQIQDLQELATQLREPHRERDVLQNMLEQMGFGVCILDKNYRIWYVNKILEKMTGGTIKAGDICWHIYYQDLAQTNACSFCPIAKMFETGEIQKKIVIYNLKGKLKYFEKVASPLFSKDGKIIAALESTQDVTESEILHHMERQVEDAIELDLRLNIILQNIKALGYDRARIYLLSSDKKEVIGKKEIGGGLSYPFENYRLPTAGDLYWEKLIRTKRAQIFTKEYGEHIYFKELGLEDVVNWLELPLIIDNDKFIGIVAIDNKYTRRLFSEEDIKVLMPYIDLAASSIRTAQKYQVMINDTEKLNRLREFDVHIARYHEFNRLVRYVTNAIVKMSGAYAGHLRMYEDGCLNLVHAVGRLAKAIDESIGIQVHPQLAAVKTWSTKQIQVISNVKADHNFQYWISEIKDPLVRQKWSEIGSLATFPLLMKGNVIGVISLHASSQDFFTDDLCNFIESLCQVAAIAIDKALLYDKEKLRVRELEKLREIDISIAKETDEKVILEKIITHCMALTGADDCFVRYKTANNSLKKVAGRGLVCTHSEDELYLDTPEYQSSLSVKAAQTGISQFYGVRNDEYFNNLLKKLRHTDSRNELNQFKSWGSFPLNYGEQVIGVLSINSKDSLFFTDERKKLIEDFEHRAAIALGQAKLFREKEDIFFDVHHSLVAPLNSMKTSADMLSDGLINDEKKKKQYYKMISANAEYFASRVTEIMNLGKIQSGLFVFNKKNYPIKSIILDVINLNRFSCDRRQIKIIKKFAKQRLYLFCDRDKIRDALQSILSNAVKFSENNKVISVMLDSDDQWIFISVKDQGIGIPEDELPRIFDKHFRGQFARQRTINKEKIDGAGFGLTVAKEIIDKHDGEIEVTSTVGKGSTFIIKLPKERR